MARGSPNLAASLHTRSRTVPAHGVPANGSYTEELAAIAG